ncbi:hypothetical protein ACQKQA_06485 [Pseudomonas sp. NPDC089530]|uniref:hypothetical protein n=1 Tax=Pseudomonas sp. NPDC089530 TaxID=3390651 RepID=UPI003CFF330A
MTASLMADQERTTLFGMIDRRRRPCQPAWPMPFWHGAIRIRHHFRRGGVVAFIPAIRRPPAWLFDPVRRHPPFHTCLLHLHLPRFSQRTSYTGSLDDRSHF